MEFEKIKIVENVQKCAKGWSFNVELPSDLENQFSFQTWKFQTLKNKTQNEDVKFVEFTSLRINQEIRNESCLCRESTPQYKIHQW